MPPLPASLETGLDSTPNTRVMVVDSHRPLHLANVDEANARVFCLLDEREAVVGGGDASEAFPAHPAEEEEDDDDDEDDEADAPGASPRAIAAGGNAV